MVFLFCHKMPPMNPFQKYSACYQFVLTYIGRARFVDWPSSAFHMNKNKKFIVDPNTNSYIIQIHQINQ